MFPPARRTRLLTVERQRRPDDHRPAPRRPRGAAHRQRHQRDLARDRAGRVSSPDGTPIANAELTAQVAARAAAAIALPDDIRTPGDPSGEVLVAELDGARTVHTWVEGVALRLDPDPIEATVTPFDDGYRGEHRARSRPRDVTLPGDRLDPAARVDDALVTFPPK